MTLICPHCRAHVDLPAGVIREDEIYPCPQCQGGIKFVGVSIRHARAGKAGGVASQRMFLSTKRCDRCHQPISHRNKSGFCRNCQRSHGLEALRKRIVE